MKLQIRPATAADATTVVGLIRALARYEKLEDRAVATEAEIVAELSNPRPLVEIVLAIDDGRAVGFAVYFHNFSTFLGRRGLYLEDLFVEPQARGRGYGAALIRHLARLAVERGCGRFEWAVLDWNEPAIGFYRALGAEVLPDWRICRVTGEALQRLGAA
ncbi:MAG TPA: GNAT family N-acetyltransferase [Burkholderiaceae bacterium]|nr:GNAT family N-acetyltransferase [Burkholderiaceae bacterium]